MSDPNYEPPKTNPENPHHRPPQSQHEEWSSRKLCFITFLPCILWVLTGLFLVGSYRGGGTALALFMLYAVPLLAFVLAVVTAAHFIKVKNSNVLEGLGYVIIWLFAHVALLFIGYFACVVIASNTY